MSKLPIVRLLPLIALLFLLAGCSNDKPAATETPEPTDEPVPTESPTDTPEPIAEPTEEPTLEPTEEIVEEPTKESTAEAVATITAIEGWPVLVTELPEGDPARGEALYTEKGCIACHGDPANPGSNPVGPHHGAIAVVGAQRVPGQSAAVYIYESILNPNAFIAPVCANELPCTEPSLMPANFAELLSQQEVADIIAFMLTLTGE